MSDQDEPTLADMLNAARDNKVYDHERGEWVTPDDRLEYLQEKAEEGNTEAIIAVQHALQLPPDKRDRWLGAGAAVNALANMRGDSQFEVDLDDALTLIEAWGCEQFMRGYLKMREKYIGGRNGRGADKGRT